MTARTGNPGTSPQLDRRTLMQLSVAGAFGLSLSRWFPGLASAAATSPQRKRSCILLWMSGGPSQTDTFDMKPGHKNGGPILAADTSIPGIRISEHLPKLSLMMKHLAPIRSMSTKEGDHGRATYVMRTGYAAEGPIRYPTMGSLLSKELATAEARLPDFISVAPFSAFSPGAYGPGYLGPRYAPLVVGSPNNFYAPFNTQSLQVRNLKLPQGITRRQADSRLELLQGLDEDFAATRPGIPAVSHLTMYEQAVRLMRSPALKAFDLDEEPAHLRDAYGRNLFGQGCLLARRLVEQSVPFIEVSLNGVPGQNNFGWDTHTNNFKSVQSLSEVLDSGWGTLLSDLRDRGLLDSTLVVWMGEFGRTPAINGNQGRDHFPNAWTTVLSGGGIRGGQVFGRTSPDGMQVTDRPVSNADLMATICKALGLDPMQQNMSNVGRPIRLADPKARPIEEILT